VDSPYFGENINPQTFETYRVKALVQPLDRLRITASAWFNRTEADGTNDANDEGIIEAPIRQPSETSYDLYSAIIEYEADAFSLISASSYIEQDWSATVAAVIAPVLPPYNKQSASRASRDPSRSTAQVAWTREPSRDADPGQHQARGPRPVLPLRPARSRWRCSARSPSRTRSNLTLGSATSTQPLQDFTTS
jgi:hypothetical protein